MFSDDCHLSYCVDGSESCSWLIMVSYVSIGAPVYVSDVLEDLHLSYCIAMLAYFDFIDVRFYTDTALRHIFNPSYGSSILVTFFILSWVLGGEIYGVLVGTRLFAWRSLSIVSFPHLHSLIFSRVCPDERRPRLYPMCSFLGVLLCRYKGDV